MPSFVSTILKRDINIYYTINRKSKSKLVCSFMKIITKLGSTPFSVIVSLLFYFKYNYVGFILILNLVFSQAVIQLLKRIVNRPRPYTILEGTNAIKPPKCKYSLPSGHSSSAMIIALVLSMFFPSFAILFLTLTILVGISRVLLGCHYPSDVFIGFFISFIIFEVIKYLII